MRRWSTDVITDPHLVYGKFTRSGDLQARALIWSSEQRPVWARYQHGQRIIRRHTQREWLSLPFRLDYRHRGPQKLCMSLRGA
jgi:hypothetical protein